VTTTRIDHFRDYKDARLEEYPPVTELADAVYWMNRGKPEIMQDYLAKVDVVKERHPKKDPPPPPVIPQPEPKPDPNNPQIPPQGPPNEHSPIHTEQGNVGPGPKPPPSPPTPPVRT
jgi:hypothetical protein